jgi:Flp pilus assembly protein TadD
VEGPLTLPRGYASQHGEAREALRNAMATRKGLEKRATVLQARIDAGEAETGILLELGSIKRRLGRYEEAAGAYRRLLEGAPANTKALFGLVVT